MTKVIVPEQGTCALCGNTTVLMKSHLIPKFVAEWLKKTSGTGYLRSANQPNIRKQDFPTSKLLCANCEGIFSQWEKRFAEDIFVPYHARGQLSFRYQDWLIRLAVSLAWRICTVKIDSFRKKEADLALEVDVALTFWRDFLLGANNDPGLYTHHMFFLDFIESSSTLSVPKFTHWYMLRGVDATIAYASKEVYAYTKFPGIVFWSGIKPAQPKGWENTRIRSKGTINTHTQRIEANGFAEFLIGRVDIAAKARPSENQQEKISQALLKDQERFIKSCSMQVLQAEVIWNS
jgi:hypothetical protein